MLLYECEKWTLLKQHERRTEAAEMKLFVSVVGYTLFDHKKNEIIRKEINICVYNLIEIMCIVHASGHNIC